MQQFQDYPKTMTHPQHRPAVIAKWDHKIKDTKDQPQGSPERFPPVVVRNFDQEQEYAAKGYVPSGKSDPEAYRRAMTGNEDRSDASRMLYPKWLYRMQDGEVDSKLVNTKDEEKALGAGWYGTPDAARAAPAPVRTKATQAEGEGEAAPKAKRAGKKKPKGKRPPKPYAAAPEAKTSAVGQAKTPEAEAARRAKISASMKRRSEEKSQVAA